MKRHIIVGIIAFALIGCAATAKIENFPKSSELINFEDMTLRNKNADDPAWNLKGTSEYMISVVSKSEEDLVVWLEQALDKNGFRVTNNDLDAKVIFAKRGLRANEWNSIAGLYYQQSADSFRVYARVDITQDITGGWKENRAKKITDSLCEISGKCK